MSKSLDKDNLLDLRGLSCPLPVVESRRKLKSASGDMSFQVLVDNVTARENIMRMAAREKASVTVETLDTPEGKEYLLTISRN